MEDVVDSIRKLLRLAKESPSQTEREVAHERAQALMHKHRIDVTAADGDHRAAIPGVVGSYWRSILLAGLARQRRCQVVKRDDGSQDTVVVGWRHDVEDTVRTYQLLYVTIATRCHVALANAEQYEISREGFSMDMAFKEIDAEVSTRDLSGDAFLKVLPEIVTKVEARRRKRADKFDEELRVAKSLWHDTFLNTIAEEIYRRSKPPVKPKPVPTYDTLQMGLPTKLDDQLENERLAEMIKATSEPALIKGMMRVARDRARQVVNELPWCLAPGRMLAAKSEAFLPPPPPPKPTRFNQIDLGD